MYSLNRFNFGKSIIKWMSTMLHNTVTCVLHNGHMSAYSLQKVGLRQGYNLSPLLFVISAEIMARKIKQSKLIHGIKLPLLDDNQEVIISQFADDTTLFVRDEDSITNVLKTLETFLRYQVFI